MNKKTIELISVLLFLSAVGAVFFYKSLLSGRIPFPGDLLISEYQPWRSSSFLGYVPGSYPSKFQYSDTVRQLYPWKMLAVDMMKRGELPLWNPHNFSGSPLLANGQTAAFYPLNILFFILRFPAAWTVYIIVQPLLAGLFTYLFSRKMKIGIPGSLIAAIAFAYSLFFTVFLEYGVMLHTLLWLPLALLSVEQLRERFTRRWSLALVGSLVMSGLAGHLQLYAGVVAFVALYVYMRGVKKNLLILFGFLLTVSIGIAMVQLMPTMELIRYSARVGHDSAYLREQLLIQPVQLALYFIPDLFGNPATRSYLLPDSYPGNALYVGIIPLLFAVIALIRGRHNTTIRTFFVLFVVLMLFIVRTPLSELVYQLPFLKSTSPGNTIVFAGFCLAVLAGFGVEEWMRSANRSVVIAAGGSFAFFVAVWLWVLVSSPEVSEKNVLYSTGVFGLTGGLLFLPAVLPKFFRFDIKKKFPLSLKKVAFALLVFVAVGDLWYFFHKFNPFVPPELVYPETTIVKELQRKTGSYQRYWGYGSAAVESNFSIQFRLYSPDGYDPLYPRWYGELLLSGKQGTLPDELTRETRSDAIIPSGWGQTDMMDNVYRLKLLDLLGVAYVLDRPENASTEKTFPEERFSPMSNEDGWRIFVNKYALPRAFLATSYEVLDDPRQFDERFYDPSFNPHETLLLMEEPAVEIAQCDENGREAVITTYAENYVDIATASPCAGLLFLSDTYYPGWRAYVDDIETPVMRAHYAFRAVAVPAGNHTVLFRYQPRSLQAGAAISIASTVLLWGVMIFMQKNLRTKELKNLRTMNKVPKWLYGFMAPWLK